MENLNRKFKDKDPVETVREAREIIHNLGFDIEEEFVDSGVGSHSCGLYILLGGRRVAFSFGKGNTHEYSLASAYGEMMERLQCDPNRITRNIYSWYNEEDLGLEDYFHAEDDFRESNLDNHLENDVIINNIKRYENELGISITTFLKNQYNTFGYIPLAKFKNASDSSHEYLNESLLRSQMMGSTGYCAGNSKYEALLQGLSEVLERYVKYRVFKDKLTLPVVTRNTLDKYTYSSEVIRNIEYSGRYKLEIRDASLGGKFPVVCAILYDKHQRGYVVSFGSFPVFEIALDRTINELLQGCYIEDMFTVKDFVSFELDKSLYEATKYTYSGTLRDKLINEKQREFYWYNSSNGNNMAIFPDELLGENFDFDVVHWGEDRGRNNEDMFNELVGLVEYQLGDKVLYKDYSFLGFPAYSIVCPKTYVDTIYGIGGQNFMNIDRRDIVQRAIYEGSSVDTQYLKDNYRSSDIISNLNRLLGKSLKYENLTEDFLQGYIEFIKGDYRESAKRFNIGTPHYYSGDRGRHLDMWLGLPNYISMMGSLGSADEAFRVMTKFYALDICENIHEACSSPERLGEVLFREFGHPMCVVDNELTELQKKAFKIIHKKKRGWSV